MLPIIIMTSFASISAKIKLSGTKGLSKLVIENCMSRQWMDEEARRLRKSLFYTCTSLCRETTFHLPSPLVHSTNNTRVQRELARTQVYANSFLNRTPKEWIRLTETVVYAAMADNLNLDWADHFNFLVYFGT